MVMEEPETNTGRRTRVGESGAPIGSALSIVLAVVAAVLGFFILRQISDEGGTSAGSADSEMATGGDAGGEDEGDDGDGGDNGGDATTTTAPPPEENVFQGAQVVVANGAREGGLAGSVSEDLGGLGFQPASDNAAIDATGGDTIQQTTIYFRPANDDAESIAETIRRAFGDDSIGIEQWSPDAAPVNPDEFDGAVVVVLGTDHADTELQDPPDPSAAAPEPGQDGDGGGNGGGGNNGGG